MFKIQRLAFWNIILCLFVILWGAWVRRSRSGAGCGEHWPLCNGQVLPSTGSYETLIEFTHRLSSGLFGILVFLVFFWVWRYPSKSNHPGPVTRSLKYAALASLIFTLIEALIGAVLVKKGLVLDDTSTARAIVIAIHLVNTLLLVASLVATHFLARTGSFTMQNLFYPEGKLLLALFAGLLWLGASGAIAALGNTLFPVESMVQGWEADLDPASHFLVQLRLYHPATAVLVVLVSMLVLHLGFSQRANDARFYRQRKVLLGLYGSGLLIGLINLALHAPTFTALLHLLWAELIWIALCRLTLTLKIFPPVPLEKSL